MEEPEDALPGQGVTSANIQNHTGQMAQGNVPTHGLQCRRSTLLMCQKTGMSCLPVRPQWLPLAWQCFVGLSSHKPCSTAFMPSKTQTPKRPALDQGKHFRIKQATSDSTHVQKRVAAELGEVDAPNLTVDKAASQIKAREGGMTRMLNQGFSSSFGQGAQR